MPLSSTARQEEPFPTQIEIKPHKTALMWFRRDLRHTDNTALYEALKHSEQVFCVFVFDPAILDPLPQKADRRVEFIWESLRELKQTLRDAGGDLFVLHDHPESAIAQLACDLKAQAVFTNKDYEPTAIERDLKVQSVLKKQGIAFYALKDQVIFEQSELRTQAGGMFSVFTPYKKAWFKHLVSNQLDSNPSEQHLDALAKPSPEPVMPSLEQLGFETTNLLSIIQPGESGGQAAFSDFLHRIDRYKTQRDFPAVKGVSYLSVHNRFGTVSIRQLAKAAYDRYSATECEGAMGWLNELIWRDFYFQILFQRPHVATGSFRPEYDALDWDTGPAAEALFDAWCLGETGYPLVDAAMRQLNQTGYQHNRLRMVSASFLTKDLGIDWRWGERYFADHLNDFDLSANNGGWQWAASTGCDAQPYFRIFNPIRQSEKFDPDGKFIRKYCPELSQLSNKLIHSPWMCSPDQLQDAQIELGKTYPHPVVDHGEARQKTLERFKKVRNRA